MKFSTLLLIVTAYTLAACNTVEGAGEDINAAGKAISSTPQKTKQKIAQ